MSFSTSVSRYLCRNTSAATEAIEFLAYDVTSISSYSKGIESLEWGYNRDKEKLPQLNLGMYYGESSGLPLKPLMDKKQMTLRKVLIELDKVKQIISADTVSGARLLNPPTKLQKDILVALSLGADTFVAGA